MRIEEDLMEKGYRIYKGGFLSKSEADTLAESLRTEKNYRARVIKYGSSVRGLPEYVVWSKMKK